VLANLSVEQSLMKASSYAKKGEVDEAEKLYQTILRKFSNNIRAQQGLAALNKYKQNNVKQSPPQETIDQLVNLFEQGQIIVVARQAEVLTEQFPDSVVVWNILGAARAQIGELEEAIEAYKKTISLKPDYADAYSNIGVALRNHGKFDEAIEAYKKSILLKPNDAYTYYNMGIALKDQDKLDEAVEAYKKSISLKPENAQAYNNLGTVLKDQSKLDEAIEAYKNAIFFNSDHAEANNNLGNALKDQGNLDEAIQFLKKAISLKPDYSEAYSNIGLVFMEQNKLEEAIELYNKARSLKPNDHGVYYNLGNALQELGRLEESESNFRQAILWKPNFYEVHRNLSFTLLNNGKLKEGLDEMEWRWKTEQFLSSQRHFSQSLWDGKQSLNGKRILLWCEQGIGDTLNWSSCLPLVSSKAEHCILECQEKLVPLLERSFPNVEVKPENRSLDKDRDDFDFHLPMGSLYKHFIEEITQNPKISSYLNPDPVRVSFWRERLSSLGKGPYIGMCWKSSVVSRYRLQHYPPILEWSPILNIPNATFINLQYKDYTDDLVKVKDEFGVTVHNFEDLDQYNNVDDVVALCAALDIVVTTKITPMIFSSGVGTPTKIANWRQSIWNNILFNPVTTSVDMFDRNTGETWDKVFSLIAEDISKQKK
jgi:tetratricopeptide (TPR) repeat protein